MMERRFEAMAARFLDLAEGTTETRNSSPERKALCAIAAAECAKAAVTLRLITRGNVDEPQS